MVCSTKIIAPDGSQLDVADEGNTISVFYKGERKIIGSITYDARDNCYYIKTLSNCSGLDEHGIPYFKNVGKYFVEKIFRCSLENGKQGRIQLDSSYGSDIFFWSLGFRVLPKYDYNTYPMIFLQTFDRSESNVKLDTFWRSISSETPEKISQNLVGVLQYFFDNLDYSLLSRRSLIKLKDALKSNQIKEILKFFCCTASMEIESRWLLSKKSGRSKQRDNGSYQLFLPYESILERLKDWQIAPNVKIEDDEDSKLNRMKYQTDYQQYLNDELRNLFNNLSNKIERENNLETTETPLQASSMFEKNLKLNQSSGTNLSKQLTGN